MATLKVVTNPTAIPVFAAGTDSGISGTILIKSYREFTSVIGSFDPKKTLHVAIRTYFENGGGLCYIVRIEDLAADVEKLEDVTILVAAGQDILAQVEQLCQSKSGLFAILDGPTGELTTENLARLPTIPDAAVYYPWLIAPWTALPIPPSAAIAGVYCSVDKTRGVWASPVGMKLQGGVRPNRKVSTSLSVDEFINPIVEFDPNTDAMVWGSHTRTLVDTPMRSHVSVRRTFNTIRRDIGYMLNCLIFRPNNSETWQEASSAINNYLLNILNHSGLKGDTAQEAFFIHVGEDIPMSNEVLQKDG